MDRQLAAVHNTFPFICRHVLQSHADDWLAAEKLPDTGQATGPRHRQQDI